jgi:hypothetical protein
MTALQLKLPNGTTCHLTSLGMRRAAKFLRWEIHTRQRYLHAGFELWPPDNVVDVGGNLGMFVLWAAPQVQQGRVVTIEALSKITISLYKKSIQFSCVDDHETAKRTTSRRCLRSMWSGNCCR